MPVMRNTFVVFLLLSIAVSVVPGAHAQTFDQYGGWQQSACAGGATGHFYFEKANNTWWMCTPAGNHFHMQALANFKVPGVNASTIWTPAAFAKYGNNTTTAAIAMLKKFMVNYHFNVVGEDSNSLLDGTRPCTGCTSYPTFYNNNISVYATVNLNNHASHPMKNYIIGVDDYFRDYTGAGCTDVFDPEYAIFANGITASTNILLNNPYALGEVIDDIDFMCGLSSNAEFDTDPPGHNKANWAYITLVTSPIETFDPGQGNLTYQSKAVLYTDTTVYSKALSSTPPTSLASCFSLGNTAAPPCSLANYLNAEYGGAAFPACAAGAAPTAIARLNQCWGANYTTMGSSGAPITNFSCGTGDGATVVFNCTLPATAGNISPLSVAIFEGTTLIGGDCYWVLGERGKCPLIGTAPSTPYNCATAGSCMGVLAGDASSSLASGSQAFLSDNPCGSSGANPSAPHASFTAIVIWHGSGTYIPSRKTGETCTTTEGDSVTAPLNPPTGATGYDVYMACRLLDTTVGGPFGCVGSGALNPPPTLQAIDVPFTTNFIVPSTGLVSGASLPAPPSEIDYGTGAVKLTFGVAPTSGTAITISAIAGGWMWGTGLLDEDGRHSWVGSNGICMTAYAGGGEGTRGYACRAGNPGSNAAVSVAPQVGIDLNNWLYQIGAQYFGSIHNAIKNTFPNALYFGSNFLGDWGSPAHLELLQVAHLYVDCIFAGIFHPKETAAELGTRIGFTEQYFGDKPIFGEVFTQASADSAISSCSSCVTDSSFGFSTQSARGTAYYNLVQTCLARVGFNGDHQCIGLDWWGSADFNSAAEQNNWGLSTPSDNDYNGIEPAATGVPCVLNSALTCGNEPAPGSSANGPAAVRPFTDTLTGPTGVIAANRLWFANTPATHPTTTPKKTPIWGANQRSLPQHYQYPRYDQRQGSRKQNSHLDPFRSGAGYH